MLPFRYSDGTIAASIRLRLTEAERVAIAEGADILVTEMTFGGPFTPISVVFRKPGEGME